MIKLIRIEAEGYSDEYKFTKPMTKAQVISFLERNLPEPVLDRLWEPLRWLRTRLNRKEVLG